MRITEKIGMRVWQFGRNRKGNITILSAAALPCCLAAATLSIDLGTWYVDRRDAQGLVDLAAMAAANNLGDAENVAKQTIANNAMPSLTGVKVTRGSYSPDPALAPSSRFEANALPFNAVVVEAMRPGISYFAHSVGLVPPQMFVKGMGVSSGEAAFALGSRLVSVRDGLANQILGSLLGGNITLSAMDHRALLEAQVQLGSFMNALATELNVTAGTYNDVLKSDASVGQVLKAAAKVLGANGAASAQTALLQIISQSAAAQLALPLTSFIDLGTLGSLAIGQDGSGLSSILNVLELVNAAAAIANAEHQVALNLGAAIPGLLSLKVDLAIGEREKKSPWVRVGAPASKLYTAQTRLRIVAEVMGSGVLADTRIRLPIAIEAAYAEARLSNITCSGSKGTVEVTAKPGIAKAWIGEMTDSGLQDLSSSSSVAPARLVTTTALKVLGTATVESGELQPTALSFTPNDIANGIVKTAETRSITESLATKLVEKLLLDVQIAGLSLTTPTLIKTALTPILRSVAIPLDSVIAELLETLGVHVGEADVRVLGVRCGAATLAG